MKVYTYELLNFLSKDTNEGLRFHKPTFMKLIKSDKFQEKLKRKIIIGGTSHECRDAFLRYSENHYCSVGNHADYLINNGLASNVLLDIWEENDVVYGKILTLPTEKGKEFDDLKKVGVDFKVSMSVEADQDDEFYYITDMMGIDFTVGPAFKTKCISEENYNAKV